MFLKKVLNQPNLVGTVLIALMVCSGFVYAFAFDGFNVETATGGEVEAWLAAAGGGGSGGGPCACGRDRCKNKLSCIGCGDYSCATNFCGSKCGCPIICTNAVGKSCRKQHGVCTKTPPKTP